ncbi:MAG: hypothetical protein J7M40_13065 [Planctomycetes bacterium]|nr:hypothetical protein [Planctomycetota bacterium]
MRSSPKSFAEISGGMDCVVPVRVLWDSAALAGLGVFDRLDNISYSFIVETTVKWGCKVFALKCPTLT